MCFIVITVFLHFCNFKERMCTTFDACTDPKNLNVRPIQIV
jgi:hypothetical protein